MMLAQLLYALALSGYRFFRRYGLLSKWEGLCLAELEMHVLDKHTQLKLY